ncbi:MAG: beta strand repeat-containing protein, partial [Sedimentibacter sp.]
MNNTLKKSLAILLAITMVLSMTTIALAEEQVFPEINSVEKRIYANGVPITIEAGPTTGTSIKYGNNSYLDLDDSDGELFEADLSEYSIYGGSKDESGLNTNITMTGGEVYAIYGSSKDMSVSSTNITMAGGEVTNIYGGGGASSGDICASVENNTAVTVNGGKVWYVYGGGNYSSVSGDAVVTVNGGTVGFLYGGGDKALVSGDAYVTVNAGTVDILYGGGSEGLVSGNTFVSISGGTIGQVYGGGRVGSVGGNTSIEISGTASITQDGDTNGFKGYVYGGSENSESTVKGNVSIKVNGGEVYKILGGGSHGTVIGDVKVEIISGAVDYVYGGGRFSDATVNNTSVLVSGGTVWAVYGGGNEGNVSYDTSVDISGGTIQNIYGGGYGDTTYDTRGIVGGNTFVTVSEGVVNGSIYGGGLIGTVIGDTSVTVSGGTFDIDSYNCGYIYGGGDNGSVSGNTFVLISDGIVRNVYGGGLIGDVSGDTSVIVSGGTMSKIYGGGSDGNVSGNTSVTISAGTIPDNMVFGGGYGTTALTGNKNGYVAIAGKADVDSFTNLINLTNDGWVLIGSPTIPVNQTMTIDDGKTLTINEDAILTNNGTLSLAGTLSGEGTLAGNGVFKKSLHVGDTITVNDMTYTGENLTPIINTETIMGKEFVYDTTGYAKTYNKINDGNWEAVTDVKEIGEYEISITNGSIVFYADFDVIGVVFSNVNTALTIKQSPIYGDNWNDILNIDASKFSAQLNSQDVVGTYTLLVDDTSFDGDSIPNQGIHSYKAVFTSADSVFKDVEVVSGSIEVAKKEVSISWGNQDFIYNGSEQKPTATITNKIGIDDVSIAVTGGMKDVGTNYTATATLTGEKADNYELPTETEVNYNIVAANVTGNVTISNTDANTNKKPDSGDT